jgi:hypothetical protein
MPVPPFFSTLLGERESNRDERLVQQRFTCARRCTIVRPVGLTILRRSPQN